MAESKKEPKVIEGNLSGTHEFAGDVVVKGNIADGANVRVKGGGLRVEGDVGNNVSIDQRDGAKFSFSSSKDGVCFTNVSGGGTFIGSVHGNMTISGDKIVINGVDVTQTLKDKQGELGLSGVEIQGKSGNDVQVRSTEGISAKGFGDRADLDAQGSIRSGEVGEQSRLGADGSIRSKDVGRGSQLSAGGSIAASAVHESSNLRAGGSTSVARAESGTVLSAGGSVSAGELGSNAQAYAGGSVTAGIIRAGATAEAGGSLNAAMVEEGAHTRAGGSKNIGSVVPPAGPAGQAPTQPAPSPSPPPATFSHAAETVSPASPQTPIGDSAAPFKQATAPASQETPSVGNDGLQRPPVDTAGQFSDAQGQAPASGKETSPGDQNPTKPTVTLEAFETPHRGSEVSVDIRGLSADELLTVRQTWNDLTGGRGGTTAGDDFSAPGTKQFGVAMKPAEQEQFFRALRNKGIDLGGEDGPSAASGRDSPASPPRPAESPPAAQFSDTVAESNQSPSPSQPIGNPQSPFPSTAAPQARADYGTRPSSPQARFSHAPVPPRQAANAEIDFAGTPSFLAGMLTALLSALGIEATAPKAQERGPVVTGNWPPPPGTPSHSTPAPGHAAPAPTPSQPGRTAAQPSQAPAANAGTSNTISSLSKSTIAEIMEAGMTLAGAKTTPQRNTVESQQAFDAMPKAARDVEIAQAHEIAKTLNPAVDQKAGRGR